MPSIVAASNEFAGDDNTITLANGSTAGRAVIVIAFQTRGTLNLTNFTIDGISAKAENVHISDVAAGGYRALIALFDNDDLPASAGSYLISRNTTVAGGSQYSAIEISGYTDGSEVVTGNSVGGTDSTSPRTISFFGNGLAFAVNSQSLSSGTERSVVDGNTYIQSFRYAGGAKISTSEISITTRSDSDQAWVGFLALNPVVADFSLLTTPTFGQTTTVTTSNWGAEDPTHVDITGPSSNVLTLPLTATATANEYTFTMPSISEVEGSTVAGLLAGAGTIRVYTQV